jgi:predicted glycoside hydrolase/deacetylase ChbG (UPF0249 family)
MKRFLPFLTTAALIAALPSLGLAQASAATPAPRTLQERLGYPAETKLLIVHADDLGMSHAVNAAAIRAIQVGLLNSGSIMVPCPWFPEIAAYARSHPETDLGLHLTLNSEWTGYRWSPILSRERTSSLVDSEGYFPYLSGGAARFDVKEAEAEVRAQIERARAFGIQPTHLDSHMATLGETPQLREMLSRVAQDTRIPIRRTKDSRDWSANSRDDSNPYVIVINKVLELDDLHVPAEDWTKYYLNLIKTIEPGVTELVLHPGYDNDELRGITADHPDWGAAWRQRDFEFLISDEFQQLVLQDKIKLITWREIAKAVQTPAK